jgi:hypothetical protein
MDEDIYRETYRRVNPLPCVFEKAILRTCCRCSLAQRLNLAEREAVACTASEAQQRCRGILESLHEKAIFTVRAPHETGPLPHGKEIRIQCGGLLGLSQTLHESEEVAAVEDVDDLLRQAIDRYGDSRQLPYQDIVRAIAAYRNRARR